MIHSMFTIYDIQAGAYLPPFILPKTSMAKRVFFDCINSDTHQFHQHPEDYTLFHIGQWDDETSIFLPQPNGPQTLGNGVEYVRQDDAPWATEGPEDAQTQTEQTPIGDDSPIQPSTSGNNSS